MPTEEEGNRPLENPKYKMIKKLAFVNNFWNKSKWYLVAILFITVLVVYYKKNNLGPINMAVIIIFAIILILIIIIFSDNNGVVGNSLSRVVSPMPPHLGLDGISKEIRFVN